jgi:hypothetical protein
MMARMAGCTMCSKTIPSSEKLAFFEFTGEDSRRAKESCKNCQYYEVAHKSGAAFYTCGNFIPHGSFENDRYYCGCIGWN